MGASASVSTPASLPRSKGTLSTTASCSTLPALSACSSSSSLLSSLNGNGSSFRGLNNSHTSAPASPLRQQAAALLHQLPLLLLQSPSAEHVSTILRAKPVTASPPRRQARPQQVFCSPQHRRSLHENNNSNDQSDKLETLRLQPKLNASSSVPSISASSSLDAATKSFDISTFSYDSCGTMLTDRDESCPNLNCNLSRGLLKNNSEKYYQRHCMHACTLCGLEFASIEEFESHVNYSKIHHINSLEEADCHYQGSLTNQALVSTAVHTLRQRQRQQEMLPKTPTNSPMTSLFASQEDDMDLSTSLLKPEIAVDFELPPIGASMSSPRSVAMSSSPRHSLAKIGSNLANNSPLSSISSPDDKARLQAEASRRMFQQLSHLTPASARNSARVLFPNNDRHTCGFEELDDEEDYSVEVIQA